MNRTYISVITIFSVVSVSFSGVGILVEVVDMDADSNPLSISLVMEEVSEHSTSVILPGKHK